MLNRRLPFDVICGIMAVSQRRTISTLMKTCHTLYTEGPRHILRDGVQLTSTYQITKFATFMLAEDPSRFAYLRQLVLHPLSIIYTDAEVDLARFLSHPSLALETLELRCAETYLGYGSQAMIRKAIGGLMTTKHLVVLGVSQYSISSFIIKLLPWNLESISIGVKHGSVQQVLPTIAPFSHTLLTVVIASEHYGPALFLDTDPESCHFPGVRTFGVVYHDSILDVLRSSAFAQAFPAITHLQLIPTEHPVTCRRTGLPTDRDPRVSRSTGFREARGPRLERPDGTPLSLSSLAECSGDLRSVYALHFDCTLSTLRLWQHVGADDLHLLQAVLEDTRPTGRLCLSTELLDVEPLFATLRTSTCPARVDLKIFVSELLVVCHQGSVQSWFSCRVSLIRRPHLLADTDPLHLRPGTLPPAPSHGVGRAQPPLRSPIHHSTCRKVDCRGCPSEMGIHGRSDIPQQPHV